MSKKIMITGSSGGFGKLTVLSLLKQGHQVAATMRNPGSKNKEVADELTQAGAIVVDMDVISTESVDQGTAEAIDKLGGLDVVINNAGRGVMGMIEHFTPEDYQRLFEVNVVGVQRVNRAALPTLRAQGSGLIIYVSSLLGRITLPFYGPYNATKWALEAMAENYRIELSGFGIQSALVEPGGFPTTFGVNLMLPSDQSRVDAYGEFMNVPAAMGAAFQESLANTPDQDPQKVADTIVDLIALPVDERPFRTIVDYMPWRDGIASYNEQFDGLIKGIYGGFGIEHLLEVKSN
jgi:NAD(P)-dependent dehydrogenase (short-subunit alcohol dehydrogenase family)